MRMEQTFHIEEGMTSADNFLYWYFTTYRSHSALRVPLSADQIAYLNSPIIMGGQANHVTRALWWGLVGAPDRLAQLNLNDRSNYLTLIYWWAQHDSALLGFEDCLVTDTMVQQLRGVHVSRIRDAWPLTYFSERYFVARPELHFLKCDTDAGRKALALVMMLAAARRPDLVRYLPWACLTDALAPTEDNGPSPLEEFVNALLAADVTRHDRKEGWPERISLSRDRYAAALRRKQFDLDSMKFLTVTAEGHRFEAAALPRPSDENPVDVQIIGPFAKASGLGQAARLSVAAIEATGLRFRAVNFGLDNPAPEGFSSDISLEPYGLARINLIHLNAESIPLAYAFEPDVFSGAYNIGYFFWELDRPAYCHYLGMDLLDEIWVSTEYGVQIYQKDAGEKPVVNVGMCVEDVEGIAPAEARTFLNKKLRLKDSHYVCLVAFDSYSFVQRKNPIGVLEAFRKAFADVPHARLVVKTQNRDNVLDPVQVAIWDRIDLMAAADRRILVLNETLPYSDLIKLKAGSDCYISLHKSEGWGFGMIEAMNLRVPVVCTAYSGNMDFCSPETAWLVDYKEVPLKQGDYIFVREGSIWAEPDVEDAARQLRACYDNPTERKARSEAAWHNIRKNFSAEAIGARYGQRLNTILKKLDGQNDNRT